MKFVRRAGAVLLTLSIAAVIAVWGGTFAESRLTGDLVGACSRALDADSAVQAGHPSMRWFPPRIHCAYAADRGLGAEEYSNNQYAVGGIAVIGLVLCVLLFALVLSWANASEPERSSSYAP